jgi:hypothetical protein
MYIEKACFTDISRRTCEISSQKFLRRKQGMKKLLVLFLSAALVLSLAAVSLAAVTVNGDFRYNMYENEDPALTDESYGETDLRVRVTGDLSETVKATVNLKWVQDSKTSGDNVADTQIDEFYAIMTESWGTVKMGHYEYKFTPSRVELKSGGYHVWKKCDTLFEVDVPVAEGFTVEGVFQPYGENDADDGAYGVAVNYKAENWGAKVSYADFKQDLDLTAIDVYYMINEDMKVFVDAVDYSENEVSSTCVYDDGFDPVIGFAWSNIADTPLYASVEYAITPRNKDESNEYDEYVVKAAYKLSNNIGLEFYHYVIGDSLTKDMFRLRYQF